MDSLFTYVRMYKYNSGQWAWFRTLIIVTTLHTPTVGRAKRDSGIGSAVNAAVAFVNVTVESLVSSGIAGLPVPL